VTGIILAGGKNSRMGVNKAFINIGGKRIIDNTLSIYKKIFSEIIVVTNTPEDYEGSGAKIVTDIIPNKGSLGGLYTGIVESKNDHCFVAACDMPFINEKLIRYITEIQGYDIVVPVVERYYEPLFAMYSKNCLSFIKEQLDNDNLRISDIFKKVRVKEVKINELRMFDNELMSLVNINTPEDLNNVLNITEET
jgi:molybdenum cofactor guanylyltransferase